MNERDRDKVTLLETALNAVYTEVLPKIEDAFLGVQYRRFTEGIPDITLRGFNEWLVLDATAAVQMPDYPETVVQALYASRKSIYQAVADGFQDIFTKALYPSGGQAFQENVLISGRLASLEGTHILIGDWEEIHPEHHPALVRYVLDQYNVHVRSNGPMELDAFIQSHPLLLYRASGMLEAIEVPEEVLIVYQDEYVSDGSLECFFDETVFEGLSVTPVPEEPGVYRVLSGHSILAEIEIAQNHLFVLCNTAPEIEQMRRAFEPFLTEHLVLMRKDVLTLDELL